MAALEAVSFFSSSQKSPLTTSHHPPFSSFLSRLTLFISSPTPSISLKFPIYPLIHVPRKSQLYCSAVEEITVQETTNPEAEQSEDTKARRKLFVANLPSSYSVDDIKALFGQCGTVTYVEVIKSLIGKHQGYVFVTMATAEEAQAAIVKFNSYISVFYFIPDVSGRIIKVEHSKRFRKPPRPTRPPPPPDTPSKETPYKLFVSNLAWKVRPSHLREFFSTSSNPVSTRVVFDGRSGKSIGYGFVSFATKEEAEAALIFNGKELFDRPITVKLSEKKTDKSEEKIETTSEKEPVVS